MISKKIIMALCILLLFSPLAAAEDNHIIIDLRPADASFFSIVLDFFAGLGADIVDSITSFSSVFSPSSLVADPYSFDIVVGDNTLPLNSTYDSNFVAGITGTFFPDETVPGEYMREFIFTADSSMDSAVINVTVVTFGFTGINSDLSNLWFYHSANLTEIPMNVTNLTSFGGTVTLQMDVAVGNNSILAVYGGSDVNPGTALSDIYLFYFNDSGGLVISENTTLYDGSFTNANFRVQPMPSPSFVYTAFTPSLLPSGAWVRYLSSNVSVVANFGGSNQLAGWMVAGTVLQFNVTVTPFPDDETSLWWRGSYSRTFPNGTTNVSNLGSSVSSLQATPVTFYIAGISAFNMTLYDLQIFNSTTVTVMSISDEIPIDITLSTPVVIPVPSVPFSSLNYSSGVDGFLVLDIFYDPHIIPLTANNTSFQVGSVQLQYLSNPSNFTTTFQISTDVGFGNIIQSGQTSGGTINANLSNGSYYWRVLQSDGSWSETRSFVVTPYLHVASYVFGVLSGANTLDLNTTFDGSFVYEINGSLYPGGLGTHMQVVTFNAGSTLANARFPVVVNYQDGMSLDWSNLEFRSASDPGTSLPFYVTGSLEGVRMVAHIRTDVVAGRNEIVMYWGGPGGKNVTDQSVVMLSSSNVSTNYTTQTTIYSGAYTNINITLGVANQSAAGTQFIWLGNNTTGTGLPRIQFAKSTAATQISGSSWAMNAQGGAMSHDMSFLTNLGANLRTEIFVHASIQPAPHTTTRVSVSGNDILNFNHIGGNSGNTPYQSFTVSAPAGRPLQIVSYEIYNTTGFSGATFSPPVEIDGTGTPVSIPVPPGYFSSLSYSASTSGMLVLGVYYVPHIVLMTPDNISFPYQNATLNFIAHPSNISARYEIAIDSNFFGVVSAGMSSGTINANLSNGSYFWRVMQPNGQWSESRTFTVNPLPDVPGSFNFLVFNESNTSQAISGTVVLINNTSTLQKSGSNISFNGSEVASGIYLAQVSASGFVTRFYTVESPGNYSFFLAANTTTPVMIRFSLLDTTNTFSFHNTQLIIQKQTATGLITIQNTYFDAAGVVDAYLIPQTNYVLSVLNDNGDVRIIGNFVPTISQSIRLVVGDIAISQYPTIFGGFGWNITTSPDNISLQWNNSANALIEPFTFRVTPQTNHSNAPFEINSDGPFGRISYSIPDENDTYFIEFYARTVNGTISSREYYSPSNRIIDLPFSPIVQNLICVIVLIIIALLFSPFNVEIGVLTVTILATLLFLLGILHVSALIIAWILFLAFMVRFGNKFVRG